MPKDIRKKSFSSNKKDRENQWIMNKYNLPSAKFKEVVLVIGILFLFILFLLSGGDELLFSWI